MPKDENACIRYVMKEMDPSEEVLIEREMMDDEDLLIEVECFRRTLKRLDDNLPHLDPPSHITEKIVRKAAERKPSRNAVTRFFASGRFRFVAAAATIAFAAMLGLMWYQFNTASGNIIISQQQSNSASVTSSSYVISPVGLDGVEPWVDRNDIIRFQDQFDSQSNQVAFDSILNYSTRKLKPINDPLQPNPRSRALQMTGSDR